MNNKWFYSIGGFVTLLLLFVSCTKKYDFDNIKLQDDYESEWGAPLFDFKSTLKDYYTTYLDSLEIEEGEAKITIAEDGLFHFMYSNESKLKTAEESFIIPSPLPFVNADFTSIPDDKWPNGLSEGIVPASYDGVSSELFVDTLYYELDKTNLYDAELERAEFKSGRIEVDMSSTYEHNIDVEYDIVSFKKNGQSSFGKGDVVLNANSSKQTFNMTDTEVDFNTPEGTNRIMVIVKSQFTLIGGNRLAKSDRVNASFSAIGLKWRVVEGKVGTFDLVNEADTLKIDVLDESIQDIENSLVIYDPRFGIRFKNTAGVPVDAQVVSFDIKKRDGSIVPLLLDNKIVSIPADAVNDVNDLSTPAEKDYNINDGNSNIVEALTGGATHLIYDIDLLGGDLTKTKLWLRDTSRLVLETSVDIPFNFSFTEYEFSDTVDCMLCDNDSINEAEVVAELKLVFENGLPIDVDFQGYFYDTLTGVVIDSLFDNGNIPIIQAAPTDGAGKVIGTTNYVKLITIGNDKYHKVLVSDFIFIASGKTAKGGGTPVQLHATDRFNVRAGVKVKVKADLSEQ